MSVTGPRRGHSARHAVAQIGNCVSDLTAVFKPRTSSSGLDDWVVDLESATFPGSQMGKTQELNETTHPHLQLLPHNGVCSSRRTRG